MNVCLQEIFQIGDTQTGSGRFEGIFNLKFFCAHSSFVRSSAGLRLILIFVVDFVAGHD